MSRTQGPAALLAEAGQIAPAIDRLEKEVHGMRVSLDLLVRRAEKEDAVHEAREEETTAIRLAPRAVEDLRRSVDALGARVVAVESRPTPATPAWADENGRRVIWWTLSAMVLCSLAIGGGLTFADLRGHFTAGGTAGLDYPPPMRAPAPPTHPAHRPLPDHPSEDQL